MPKSNDELEREKIQKLGELIFNGNIIFLSIVFGLFALSLGNITKINNLPISISSTIGYSFIVTITLLSGVISLGLSFFGINNNNLTMIKWAALCSLVMLGLTIFVYSQMYTSALETAQKINLNLSH